MRSSATLAPVSDPSQRSAVAAREQSRSTATRVETANATAELINLLLPIMAGTALSVLALHLLTHSGHSSGGGPRLMHH